MSVVKNFNLVLPILGLLDFVKKTKVFFFSAVYFFFDDFLFVKRNNIFDGGCLFVKRKVKNGKGIDFFIQKSMDGLIKHGGFSHSSQAV